MKRLLALAWVAALLGGCGLSPALQAGQAAHVTLYLPGALPHGLRYRSARRIGPHMVYLDYGAARRTLVLFESPEPIAPPPGAVQAGANAWEAVAVVRGETVRSLLLRRPQTYIEAVATGLSAADLRIVQDSLQAHAP